MTTAPSGSKKNRLAQETSPYLLQHADNPVDWYPWGTEALELAQRANKPILLSIGYSACHWCHVMAHESFEDPATAEVMNRLFVNIKVDREERPDLDKIYQAAQQMLTQRGGGWPLTMFLAPQNQRPFFGGTYFPPEPRYGMPAFRDVLQRVASYHDSHRDEIEQQSAALMQVFGEMTPPPATTESPLHEGPINQARVVLERDFDREFGGFGDAPKFPHANYLEFLLRHWRDSAGTDTPDLQALYMATLTLTRMAEGGIYDHVGGGFCRYSVDQYWMIPHFEKMLYDNAQLLGIYAQATVATGDPLFSRIANQTADWTMRDMQAPEGGYWSTLDADSEGHEGRFYVWQAAEVQQLLPADLYAAFAARYGLDRPGNFEGSWHLHAFRSVDAIAQELAIDAAEVQRRIDAAREILLPVRDRRVWPGRDEKILTSWNGLMIGGMAIAARHLSRPDLADSATRALDFLQGHLWRDGRLLAVYKDGQSRFAAYLDDYAFLLAGVLELLETRWRSADLKFATDLADALLTHFADEESGGFYFTADDHEALIHRTKSFADEAVPSGNGVAAFALARLGHLIGEPRYLIAAEQCLRAGWSLITRYPQAHATLLLALDEYLQPIDQVVLRGESAQIRDWLSELAKIYAPRRRIYGVPDEASALPPTLASKSIDPSRNGEPIAYICRGPVCSEPVKSLSALISLTRS